ncbi:MAG: ABC transporter substrate-binding protein [Proteobacteria bacterium]|nr:ABC transporter substrate-binding protein [Pseudomonadota bacterium]
MANIPLTIACGDYDRTRALREGRIGVEGCDVTYIPLEPEEVFFRAFRHLDFDVAELSLSSYLVKSSRGQCPYIGIPAFVSRSFRHSGIFIRTDRGIRTPQDLKGRKVGVPEYQVTAAVWIRGMLEEEYGVAPTDINWVTGGVEEPGRPEKVALDLPPKLSIAPAPPGKILSAMLAEGEIDAIAAAAPNFVNTAALKVGLPWFIAEAEATRALMGDDFWPYGLEGNEKTLDALLRYSHVQGLSARRMTAAELFAPSSLERFKV